MSQVSAHEACRRALEQLRGGRSPLIEPAQHGIEPDELVEIARAVRLELSAEVHVAWSDGAVRYHASFDRTTGGRHAADHPS